MKELNKLDFNLIKALDALLTENSVTRAAERIGVTQPAMSGMLIRLREAFNDPLFIRVQRGVCPTDRAKSLILPVKQILGQVNDLLKPAEFIPETADVTFNIAATDYALRAIAIPFIVHLKKIAPNIKIALLPIDSSNINDELERGELDLVLLTRENTPNDLHMRTLYDEHYVCVFRKGHPLVQSESITIEQFCSADHVLVSYSGGKFRGITDDVLSQIGHERNVSLSIKCFSLVTDIILSTDMISVLPSRLLSGVEGIVSLYAPIDIPGFQQVVAWHERSHQDPAHQWIRNILFESCTSSM